ncbi:hypothetical protein [Lewinella sp. W8]|uniref:hypothetical protein n=1 Tax=Lewinella sp. W8 TaxID=2528208 RepID=UPI0010675327|nr:hypothetical protein [Lewinella sp. W8]MTB51457.1 hypothetical protein [Lewinella sp. W8]
MKYVVLFLGLILVGCTTEPHSPECYQLSRGTHLARLYPYGDHLVLSYVDSRSDGHRLMMADVGQFPLLLDSVEVSRGDNWFVNWADFPSVVPYHRGSDSARFAHWLQYSGRGTYDYDIMVLNQGRRSTVLPAKLHQDTVSAEHGFLSSAQLPGGGLQVSWLDGRYTKSGADAGAGSSKDDHGHGHGGAMTLRTKEVSDSVSMELDHRVCDCCNTATVATDELIMVAYRDRSENEIRDIGYVTKATGDGSWSTPQLVHADNWEISGCPVNGPALGSNAGGEVAVAWFTGAQERPRIQFARYDGAVGRFTAPVVLDDQSPLGRVDLQLDDSGTAFVTGLSVDEKSEEVFLSLWVIAPDDSVAHQKLSPASGARASGFPRIALHSDQLYWARTVVGETAGGQFVEVCRQPTE